MAPELSDPFTFASIHLLPQKRQQQEERPSRSFGLHNILPYSSSSAVTHDSRRHGKHRSRRRKVSKLPLHYLKPGALAQMRDAQKCAARSASFSACWSKRRLLDDRDECEQTDTVLDPTQMLGYEIGRGARVGFWPEQVQTPATSIMPPSLATRVFGSTRVSGPLCPQRKKLLAPKTPLPQLFAVQSTPAITPASTRALPTDSNNESYLELLPLDLLVRIVCNLHHDQLKPAFHVSKRLRQAVLIARQCHFDFTTPDRERQDAPLLTTQGATVNLPLSRAHAAGSSKPATPRAPRQAPKPPQARVPAADMQQLAGSLFQGHGNRPHWVKPPSLPRPVNRVVASHRVLFYEEQLCQAVAQNSI